MYWDQFGEFECWYWNLKDFLKNELCHDGLPHRVNAANNAFLFVEGHYVNEESIVNLLNRLKGNSKRISGSSLSPLGDQIPWGDSAYERGGDAPRLA